MRDPYKLLKKLTSMTSIYVLRLTGDNYYIGRSRNVMSRINKHFQGEGSAWTKFHKPIKIIEIIRNCDHFDEDKYTLMYMSIYGIEKVRGGAFCSINLGGADRYILNRMICNATDKCVKCNQFGHYFTDCPVNKNKKRKLTPVYKPQEEDITNDSSEYDATEDEVTEDEGNNVDELSEPEEISEDEGNKDNENELSEPEEISEDEDEKDEPIRYVLRSTKKRKKNNTDE